MLDDVDAINNLDGDVDVTNDVPFKSLSSPFEVAFESL